MGIVHAYFSAGRQGLFTIKDNIAGIMRFAPTEKYCREKVMTN